MVKEEIKNLIEKAIKKIPSIFIIFKKEVRNFLVEPSKEKRHGDYSTGLALVLAKKLQKNPMEIADQIVKEINANILKDIGPNKKFLEKIEAVPPGFINFHLSKEFFIKSIKEILKSRGLAKNNDLKGQKVIIEYTDPNPFKEFHIGHLMSNIIGESIARILEFQGAKVKRANYQGDVGIHVAKAVFGKIKNLGRSWQDGYVFGSEKYEKDEKAKKEIISLNKKIFERSDKNINKIYDQGKKESLENFENIYKKLGTKFDYYFFESKAADIGKKIVKDNLVKIFEKGKNKTIIFKGEKWGLHTRVFINSEGLPTYEAKELGLAKIKYKKYKYNKSIIVTGNEVNEYFKVLLKAMANIFPELAEKTRHIGHGMMRLPRGKMSSRTGNVVTFEFLLNEVENLVKEKIKIRDLSEKEKKEIKEKVAIGALKYSILKQSIGNDIIYDFKKSISFEGDSGPYLQYSYTRANSVLEKAKKERIKASLKNSPAQITQLEKIIHHFPEIVGRVGQEYEPHHIVLYLTELARDFNSYYGKNKIVDKNDQFSPYKVALTETFSMIMKNGLWLLGIPVLNKM